MEFQVQFWHPSDLRLWRTSFAINVKIDWWNSNVQCCWTCLQRKISKIIDPSIPQNHLLSDISMWDTLYIPEAKKTFTSPKQKDVYIPEKKNLHPRSEKDIYIPEAKKTFTSPKRKRRLHPRSKKDVYIPKAFWILSPIQFCLYFHRSVDPSFI